MSTLNDLHDVLNPKKLPKAAHQLNTYGKESLGRLCTTYGVGANVNINGTDVVLPTVIDEQRAPQQYLRFKGYLQGLRGKPFKEVCEHLSSDDIREIFPDFSTLAEICLVMPLTSVPCERGFSMQNRVKTRLRSRMKVAKLARKMKIRSAKAYTQDLVQKATEAFTDARKKDK